MNTQDQKMWNEKLQWAQNLKIGDIVCDCSFCHLKIIDLKQRFIVKYPGWLPNIMFADWMPFWVDSLYCKVARYFKYVEFTDTDLILEGGGHCSAMHYCDANNHSWKHPEKYEE